MELKFEKKKFGRFEISKEMFSSDVGRQALLKIFSFIVPLRMDWSDTKVTVHGYSDFFGEVEEGDVTPFYILVYTVNEHSIKVEKV